MAFTVVGCATYYNKPYQKISVHTGVDSVKCTLETEKAKYIVIAPDVVNVERSPYEMRIICEKAGYLPAAKLLTPVVDVYYMHVNLLNALVPGTAYDIASRAIYFYPEIVTMNMKLDPKRITIKEEEVYEVLKKGAPVVKPVLEPVSGYKPEYGLDSAENAEYVRVQEVVSESAKK